MIWRPESASTYKKISRLKSFVYGFFENRDLGALEVIFWKLLISDGSQQLPLTAKHWLKDIGRPKILGVVLP